MYREMLAAQITVLVSVLWTEAVHAFEIEARKSPAQKFGVSIKPLMDEDTRKTMETFRLTEGSGDDDGHKDNDLANGTLEIAEIMAIIIGVIATTGVLLFVGSCVWHKTRRRRSSTESEAFVQVPRTEDDSALHMIDYDEISIQNAKLTIDVKPGLATSTDA